MNQLPITNNPLSAIFLAAGTSSRYGNGINKLLLPFDGELVVQRSLRNLVQAGVQHIVVVTGYQHEQIREAISRVEMRCTFLHDASLQFAHNPHYREGEMISSIKTGLRAISPPPLGEGSHRMRGVRAATVITLGDQPLLPPPLIQRVIQAFQQGCGHIIAPRFQGQRGHPVLLHQRFFDEALALPPGAFLRDLLKRHPEAVTHLQVNTDVILRDVDTPEAYEAALGLMSALKAISGDARGRGNRAA